MSYSKSRAVGIPTLRGAKLCDMSKRHRIPAPIALMVNIFSLKTQGGSADLGGGRAGSGAPER